MLYHWRTFPIHLPPPLTKQGDDKVQIQEFSNIEYRDHTCFFMHSHLLGPEELIEYETKCSNIFGGTRQVLMQ